MGVAPVSGRSADPVDYVHQIDDAIADTNALRADLGKPDYPVDLSYRGLQTEDELIAVLALWNRRFKKALKKSFWWQLALCESNGNWSMRGKYEGGFSFHRKTWNEYRGPDLPVRAYLATPAEQLRVARRVLADQGWDAWPACSEELGLHR